MYVRTLLWPARIRLEGKKRKRGVCVGGGGLRLESCKQFYDPFPHTRARPAIHELKHVIHVIRA